MQKRFDALAAPDTMLQELDKHVPMRFQYNDKAIRNRFLHNLKA